MIKPVENIQARSKIVTLEEAIKARPGPISSEPSAM